MILGLDWARRQLVPAGSLRFRGSRVPDNGVRLYHHAGVANLMAVPSDVTGPTDVPSKSMVAYLCRLA